MSISCRYFAKPERSWLVSGTALLCISIFMIKPDLQLNIQLLKFLVTPHLIITQPAPLSCDKYARFRNSVLKSSIKWSSQRVYLSSSSLRSVSWIICTLIRSRGISINHKKVLKHRCYVHRGRGRSRESEGIPILHDTKWAAWSTWVALQVTLQTWWSLPTCTPRRFSVRGCVSKVPIVAITSVNLQKFG